MKRSMLVSLAVLGVFAVTQADAQVAFRDVSKHRRGQAVFEASANACGAATGESPESAAYRQCMQGYGYRAQNAAPAPVAQAKRAQRSASRECGVLEALFGCESTAPAPREARLRDPDRSRRVTVTPSAPDDTPSPSYTDSPSPPPVDVASLVIDQTSIDTMNQANAAAALQQVQIDADIARQTEQAANLTTNFGQ